MTLASHVACVYVACTSVLTSQNHLQRIWARGQSQATPTNAPYAQKITDAPKRLRSMLLVLSSALKQNPGANAQRHAL